MKEKINVLYVSPNGFVGGAEAFVLEVSGSHQKDGPFHIVNLFFNPGEAVQRSRDNGIETVLLPFKLKLTHPLKLLKTVLFCRKLIIDKKIDVIHSTMPYAHIVMSLSAAFLKVKKVWFQHGPIDGILDKIGNWFLVDALMFNSRFLVEEHHKLSGLRPNWGERIIPLGITPKQVSHPEVGDLEKHFKNDSQKTFVVGVAGRINRFKGYHLFIEAISILKKTLDKQIWDNCLFPIIGGANSEADKNYLSELTAQVKNQALEDKVIFLGHKSNINDYLKVMDIFLHCSPEEEAISIVAAEAMLQDTLVIGSGIGDIVFDGKTGFELDTSKAEAPERMALLLKEILTSLSSEPHAYDAMIKSGKDLILSEYSKEKMSKDVEEVYSEIMKI